MTAVADQPTPIPSDTTMENLRLKYLRPTMTRSWASWTSIFRTQCKIWSTSAPCWLNRRANTAMGFGVAYMGHRVDLYAKCTVIIPATLRALAHDINPGRLLRSKEIDGEAAHVALLTTTMSSVSSWIRSGYRLALALLTDPKHFWKLATLVIIGDAVLTQLIIMLISCEYGRVLLLYKPNRSTRHGDRLGNLHGADRSLPKRRTRLFQDIRPHRPSRVRLFLVHVASPSENLSSLDTPRAMFEFTRPFTSLQMAVKTWGSLSTSTVPCISRPWY